MTFNKTLLTATLLTVGGFAAMSSANAADATDTFDVNMQVDSNCLVTAGGSSDINLETVTAGVVPSIGTSTINVACSKGTGYTIAMLPSGVSSAGLGEMAGTATNEETIGYQLTTDASGDTPWTDGLVTGTGGGTGTNQEHSVYAVLTTSTDVLPDTYSENVTVAVTY